MNATNREHPLLYFPTAYWVYDRYVKKDRYPLIPDQSEPTLNKEMEVETETVYQEVVVTVEDGEIIPRTLNDSEVPLEQVTVIEPTNLQRVDPYEEV